MSKDRLEEARRSIAEWADRPPQRTPAQARTRVLARLEERRRPPLLKMAAAMVTAIALAAVVLLAPRWPFSQETGVARMVSAAARHQSVLVYELSSGTTLYVTLSETPGVTSGTPAGGQGGMS